MCLKRWDNFHIFNIFVHEGDTAMGMYNFKIVRTVKIAQYAVAQNWPGHAWITCNIQLCANVYCVIFTERIFMHMFVDAE